MSFFSIDAIGPVWMDGRIVPSHEASLHVLSHGLNNASCVFEGERVYRGVVFKLKEHTERLIASSKVLGIELPYRFEQLCEATLEVVRVQKLRDGYVRPVIWRGHENLGIDAPGATTHVAIAALAFDDVIPNDVRKSGVSLKTSTWVKPAPNMSPVRAKASCHYVLGSLAIREAKAAGYDDALFLDYRGYVAESTGSNFFFVKNETVYTPIPECALDGITRRTVIDLARQRGLEVIEKHVHPEELLSAQEVFLTGTACEILSVRRLDDLNFSEARPITEKIAQDYFQLVGKE